MSPVCWINPPCQKGDGVNIESGCSESPVSGECVVVELNPVTHTIDVKFDGGRVVRGVNPYAPGVHRKNEVADEAA